MPLNVADLVPLAYQQSAEALEIRSWDTQLLGIEFAENNLDQRLSNDGDGTGADDADDVGHPSSS